MTTKNMAFPSTNVHSIEIDADKEKIFKEIISWGEAAWWPKKSLMEFSRKTSDPIKAGTIYRQRVRLPFAPSWDACITEIVENRKITRCYSNSFLIGEESVEIKTEGSAQVVEYSMEYRIDKKISRILWRLFFERMHDKNIRLILSSLKKYLEDK